MKVAIRADASYCLGSGHLMRCLCLADALQLQGAEVWFLCCGLPEHLQRMVGEKGHLLIKLPSIDTVPAVPEDPWSNERQTQDAENCTSALADAKFDWIVVDHYGLGTSWESQLRQSTKAKLLVIDDLAREHVCDVLLDQNFYPDAAVPYSGRIPLHSQLLLGPRYALLRPEFHVARQRVMPREGTVRRLLIFLGGMDANNVTVLALDAIALLECSDLAVDVVIGQTHPAREAIESTCQSMPRTRCHVQTNCMADLLATADLAIGAGGSANWERCALGVPTLALCLAENQREIIFNCSRQGLLYAPDHATSARELAMHLRALLDNQGLRYLLSCAGMEMVDALGSGRVVAVMSDDRVDLRKATTEDCLLIHAWRNAAGVRAMSRDDAEIPLEAHQRWYEAALESSTRHLLIGEDGAQAVGVVRFDFIGSIAEVSIFLCPDQMGRGQGFWLLRAAERWIRREHPGISVLQAETMATNLASKRLFERSGYYLQFNRFSKVLAP